MAYRTIAASVVNRLGLGCLALCIAAAPTPTLATFTAPPSDASKADKPAQDPTKTPPAEITPDAEAEQTQPTTDDAAADAATPDDGDTETTSDAPAQSDPAADREKAKGLYDEGTKAYALGQYEVAVRRFQEAWELTYEPQLLYNMGQAHWKWFDVDPTIEHLRQARVFFTNYNKRMRSEAGYNPAEVDGFIRALTAQIEAEEAKKAERERPVYVGPSIAELDAAERRREERRRQLQITRGLNASGITFIVVGSLSLAMGVGGILARQANGIILDTTSGGEPGTINTASAEEDERRRDGYSIGGNVAFAGFVMAGVFLPVGITLRVIGGVREKRQARKDGKSKKKEKPTKENKGSHKAASTSAVIRRTSRLTVRPSGGLFTLWF